MTAYIKKFDENKIAMSLMVKDFNKIKYFNTIKA